MRLPTSRRPVGKHRRIVAVQDTIEQRPRAGLVDLALCYILVEDPVEAEFLIFDPPAAGDDGAGELLDRIVFGRVEDSVVTCIVSVLFS